MSSDSFSSLVLNVEDTQDIQTHDDYVTKMKKDETRMIQYNLQRPNEFEDYFEEKKGDVDSIFNLPGIKFVKFSHKKIKFTFQPSQVANLVSQRLVFIISLKYRIRFWMVKRDYLPVNYKWKIYKLFYTDRYHFRFTDSTIASGIKKIWKILYDWAQQDHQFRKNKCYRYRNGEDVYLDEDDEELFLTDSEITDLHRKRNEIWERMLPSN